MNKEEYLRRLEVALSGQPQEFKSEIIDEFRNHFAAAEEEGLSEEQIIRRLGPVDDVIDGVLAMFKERGDASPAKSSEPEAPKYEVEITIDREQSREEALYEEGSSGEGHSAKGELTASVDTVIIEGNLDIEMMPGMGAGFWEYTPSPAFKIGFSFLRNLGFGGSAFESDTFDIDVEATDRTVKYTLEKGFGRFRIELPPSVRFVYIKGKSGDLEASDLLLDELNFNTLSGDAVFTNCEIGNLSVEALSGDIDIDGAVGAVRVSTTSGDVNVESNGPSVDIHGTSGDLTVSTYAPIAKLETVSGDIEFKSLSVLNDVSLSTVSGDVFLTCADTNYTATVKTLSGDFDNDTALPAQRISRNLWTVGSGQGRAEISTVSGDIELAQ